MVSGPQPPIPRPLPDHGDPVGINGLLSFCLAAILYPKDDMVFHRVAYHDPLYPSAHGNSTERDAKIYILSLLIIILCFRLFLEIACRDRTILYFFDIHFIAGYFF